MFEEHFSFVWRCLRSKGVPASDLDDLTQEVFVIVHRRFNDLDVDLGVRPWLYGIATRVVQNHRRVQRRASSRRGTLDTEPASIAPNPEQTLAARQAAEVVERALAQVEATRREVFWLAELEGLTIPEVAAALEIPLNTAYSRLRLARADFSAALGRLEAASR